MHRECREHFPCHWIRRKPLVIDPGMHYGTCMTHVPWCVSGWITRGGEENVPRACATRNFAYLARGPLIINRFLSFFPGYGQAGSFRIVTPWSLFRIGSVSKPVTAMGVLKLHERGKLCIDCKVFGPAGTKSGGLLNVSNNWWGAIVWTNANLFSIAQIGTNLNGKFVYIRKLCFKKVPLICQFC